MLVLFSGPTGDGMTDRQQWTVSRLLSYNRKIIDIAAHSDTLGSDVQFDWICKQIKIIRQSLPFRTTRKTRRAKCDCEFVDVVIEDRPKWMFRCLSAADILIYACSESVESVELAEFLIFNNRPVIALLLNGDLVFSYRPYARHQKRVVTVHVPFDSGPFDLRYVTEYEKVRQKYLEKKTFAILRGLGHNSLLSAVLGLFEADQGGTKESDGLVPFRPTLSPDDSL